MSTLTIRMPEGLAKQLQVCAAEDGVTVDQFIAAAAGEKFSALMTLDHLRERAARATETSASVFGLGQTALCHTRGALAATV